jgi:hypothetical protein
MDTIEQSPGSHRARRRYKRVKAAERRFSWLLVFRAYFGGSTGAHVDTPAPTIRKPIFVI